MLDFTVAGVRYRESSGTDDYTTALRILEQRVEDRRIGRPVSTAAPTPTTLQAYVALYLAQKTKISARWHANVTRMLATAVAHFGAVRQLATIDAADVLKWDGDLERAGLSGAFRRHHLNALRNLYGYAGIDKVVPAGYNPVAAIPKDRKPKVVKRESHFLEIDMAALFLEAAKRYVSPRPDLAVPFAYELIAALLLTGGRPAEVLALTAGDVNLSRGVVSIRGTKTENAARTVPLWPQLAAILRPYLAGKADDAVLFPIKDLRKMLAGVAGSTGVAALADITPYTFRHTYCAARLQTLDNGAPVSMYTVGKEMGHGGDALVRRVYGHLGQVRPRGKAVEFRIERHRITLRKHIARLQWGRLTFQCQPKVEQAKLSA
jgi:integrase